MKTTDELKQQMIEDLGFTFYDNDCPLWVVELIERLLNRGWRRE